MTKPTSTSYAQAHPVILTAQRKRIALQILSCINRAKPSLQLKTSTLLDIGCSSGTLTFLLAEKVQKAIGIDIDAGAVEQGGKQFIRKNLHLVHVDGKHIPFPSKAFDIVIFRRSYQYIEDLLHMVKEVHRVLKPQGLCYFEGTNKLFPFEDDYFLPFLPLLPTNAATLYVRLFGRKKYYLGTYQTYWELTRLFSQFRITHITPNILKYPKKYQFIKFSFLTGITSLLSLSLLQKLEPMYPVFIWILRKTDTSSKT